MNKLYAVEIGDNVSYVKEKEELYLYCRINDLDKLYPYVTDKRGVYILAGNNNQLYVGEGDIYNRLTRHKQNKEWVEEVYVYLKPSMTKEDSLVLEGSIYHFLKENSDYKVTNKDKVRDNTTNVSSGIQKFMWLGLAVNIPKQQTIRNIQGEQVFDIQHTVKDTYKIMAIYKDDLDYLKGYEFKAVKDVQVVVNTIGGNVGG